jgi:hypothetical protein
MHHAAPRLIAPARRRLIAVSLLPLAGAPRAAIGHGAPRTLNSVDTVVDDMRLMNDLPLRGYEDRTVGWYVGPGYNQMGNDPRTTNTAAWFKQTHPELIDRRWLRALLPWIVILDGRGHAAANVRVHLRDIRAFVRSRRRGEWLALGHSPGASGHATPKRTLFGGSLGEDARALADGSVAIKPPADPRYAWHGWWRSGRVGIEPTDIAAVFVTVQARLVVDDPHEPDDRDAARLLLQVGADYYPDARTNWTVPAPAVATSRSKCIRRHWQAFNVMTFSDVGRQDPGGGITEAEFRAVPPPLD